MPNGAGFTRRRGENGGRTPVPPDSQARTGPSWSDPGGNAVGVPPLPSDCHEHPSAGGDAAGPPGPARAAQSVGHVTAQSGPGGPGCRLAERPRSESGRAELANVERGPGPARARGGAQWRGPRAGSTSPGRGAERRRSDADTGRPAGPAREGHVLQGACLGGGGSVQRVQRVGQGCQRGKRADRAENKRRRDQFLQSIASELMGQGFTRGF
jgi:hypothetical protein